MASYAQGIDALNQSLSEVQGIDVSFELFPPKTASMEQTLWIHQQMEVGPILTRLKN